MPLRRIYIIRHGFRGSYTVDPSTGVAKSSWLSPTGIHADPALTAHGVEQSIELASALERKIGTAKARLYSSPFYRCIQTLRPYARKDAGDVESGGERVGRVITIDPGLGEWYGKAPFTHTVPAHLSNLSPLFPDLDLRTPGYGASVTPNVNGETLPELYTRCSIALERLIADCDSAGVEVAAICSHAASIIAMCRVLTGDVPEKEDVRDFETWTAGVTGLKRRYMNSGKEETEMNGELWKRNEGLRGGWECVENSDTSHLSGGEERGWLFSGDEAFGGTVEDQQENNITESRLLVGKL